uniref:Uncharacterized protein n=1 Tax=Anguilla anguilla TaxID=7936 RepID=A0A0E9TYU6_ANGAN
MPILVSLCHAVVKSVVLKHILISWKYAFTKFTITPGTLKKSKALQIRLCGTEPNAFARY